VKVFDSSGLQKRTVVPSFPYSVADTLAASVDDYTPPTWNSGITRLELTPASGGTVVTGLNSSVHLVGDVVAVINDAAAVTDNLQFANESGSSSAANRFVGIGGEDFILAPGGGVLLMLSSAGWKFLQ